MFPLSSRRNAAAAAAAAADDDDDCHGKEQKEDKEDEEDHRMRKTCTGNKRNYFFNYCTNDHQRNRIRPTQSKCIVFHARNSVYLSRTFKTRLSSCPPYNIHQPIHSLFQTNFSSRPCFMPPPDWQLEALCSQPVRLCVPAGQPSKFKVTRGRIHMYTWRPGGGTILDLLVVE